MDKDETVAERRTRLKDTGWIGVDLDATLAEYHGWKDGGEIGAPIPAMVDRVKRWLSDGVQVRVFTARISEGPGRDVAGMVSMIEAWCLEHVGRVLPVTNVKDYQMIELYDDRAVQIVANTGERADNLDEELGTPPLRNTPLGKVAAVVNAALYDIEDAVSTAEVERAWPQPGISLEPDGASLGYVLILDFGDQTMDCLDDMAVVLEPVLKKWGVARIEGRQTVQQSVDTPGFEG